MEGTWELQPVIDELIVAEKLKRTRETFLTDATLLLAERDTASYQPDPQQLVN